MDTNNLPSYLQPDVSANEFFQAILKSLIKRESNSASMDLDYEVICKGVPFDVTLKISVTLEQLIESLEECLDDIVVRSACEDDDEYTESVCFLNKHRDVLNTAKALLLNNKSRYDWSKDKPLLAGYLSHLT